MGPPAAPRMLERRASGATKTLHDILCCYQNPHEFSFRAIVFYIATVVATLLIPLIEYVGPDLGGICVAYAF